MRTFDLRIVVAAASCAWLTSCGGCYHTGTPQDFQSDPATACLTFTAPAVSACSGGFLITVHNGCTEALALSVGSAPAGGTATVEGVTNDALDVHGRHFFDAKLGATAVHVSYVIQ